MKRLQIITMIVVLVLGISSRAGSAAVSDPLAGFWVYDNLGTGDSDGHVDISLVTAGPGILKCSTGNGTWNSIGPGFNLNTIHIETGTAKNHLIQSQHKFGARTFTTAKVTLLGSDAKGLWNNAILNFDVNSESVLCTPRDGDHVGAAPHTPISAAAWLMGSGVIGLIGIKRKNFHQLID